MTLCGRLVPHSIVFDTIRACFSCESLRCLLNCFCMDLLGFCLLFHIMSDCFELSFACRVCLLRARLVCFRHEKVVGDGIRMTTNRISALDAINRRQKEDFDKLTPEFRHLSVCLYADYFETSTEYHAPGITLLEWKGKDPDEGADADECDWALTLIKYKSKVILQCGADMTCGGKTQLVGFVHMLQCTFADCQSLRDAIAKAFSGSEADYEQSISEGSTSPPPQVSPMAPPARADSLMSETGAAPPAEAAEAAVLDSELLPGSTAGSVTDMSPTRPELFGLVPPPVEEPENSRGADPLPIEPGDLRELVDGLPALAAAEQAPSVAPKRTYKNPYHAVSKVRRLVNDALRPGVQAAFLRHRQELEAKIAFTDATGMKQAYEQALALAKNEAVAPQDMKDVVSALESLDQCVAFINEWYEKNAEETPSASNGP